MKTYKRRLEDFLKYAGEPSEKSNRDNVFLVISIVYILLAGIILFFGGSRIMVLFGYDKGIIRFIAISALVGFSYVMFVCWIVIENKKCWNKVGKIVSSENCWIIIKILFVIIFIFELIKGIVLYVLGKPKQGVVINYLAEISIAFLGSLIIMVIESVILIKGLIPICDFFEISITEKFIYLLLEISLVGLFFFSSEKLSHLSISREVRREMKTELEQNGIINVKEMLGCKLIEGRIEQRENERCKQFDLQFRQTRLLCYVAMVFLLLIVPVDENDVYGKIFIEQFMGVATLAALLREVETVGNGNGES